MRHRIFGAILICIAVFSCKVGMYEYTPLPSGAISVSEELKYIVSTDQKDRKEIGRRIIFGPKNKHVKEWQRRDSVRVSRVYDLYKSDSIKTGRDKFNAGLIFFHGNQIAPETDCFYYSIAYNLFDSLKYEKDTSLIINGLHWSKLTLEHMKKCR